MLRDEFKKNSKREMKYQNNKDQFDMKNEENS